MEEIFLRVAIVPGDERQTVIPKSSYNVVYSYLTKWLTTMAKIILNTVIGHDFRKAYIVR